MPVSVHHWPFVTTVSIDVFSSFTTNIKKETRSFWTREPVTSLWEEW
jgi:hypothetical protein